MITIVFLDWLERLATYYNWVALKNSGVYVGREGIWHWFWQMTAWILILTLVKVIICLFMWLFSVPLAYVGAILFKPLQNNIRFELLFVMIFFPGVLNIIYFWITDSYLKAGKEHYDLQSKDGGEKDASPVSNIGESVTPYSQMGTVGEGGQIVTGDELRNGESLSYGSTPSAEQGTLV